MIRAYRSKIYTIYHSFIRTLFPPDGDTCNNKHQITNIVTSMSLYIHYVREREKEEKNIYIYTTEREKKIERNKKQNIMISRHELIGNI